MRKYAPLNLALIAAFLILRFIWQPPGLPFGSVEAGPTFVGPPTPAEVSIHSVFGIEPTVTYADGRPPLHGWDATIAMVRAEEVGARVQRTYLLHGEGTPVDAEIVGRKLHLHVKDWSRVRIDGLALAREGICIGGGRPVVKPGCPE